MQFSPASSQASSCAVAAALQHVKSSQVLAVPEQLTLLPLFSEASAHAVKLSQVAA
jgi:hypothetical protein